MEPAKFFASMAHSDIKVISDCDEHLVDWVKFQRKENQPKILAKFGAVEIFLFHTTVRAQLLQNMRNYQG